jgi:hypothetical protein
MRISQTWGLLLLVSLPMIVGCQGSKSTLDDATAEGRYETAIADACTAEPSEIVTTLTPLVPHNDALVWRTAADSTRQVLVVTWGGSETLPTATAGDTITAETDVWVTAAPALQRFCRSLDRSGDALVRRLA